jgi:hypothetical protein
MVEDMGLQSNTPNIQIGPTHFLCKAEHDASN